MPRTGPALLRKVGDSLAVSARGLLPPVGTISPLATELMLELRLFTTPGSTSEVYASTTALRVSGGVLSIERDPIRSVTYAQGQWAYRGKQFRMLAVSGGARLVFGNAREPTIISDPIDHFLFTGPILSTDGVPIAKYNEHQNTWLGLLRPMWWLSMRIVEIDILRSMADRRGHSAAFSRQPQSPIETTARSAPGAEKGKNCTV